MVIRNLMFKGNGILVKLSFRVGGNLMRVRTMGLCMKNNLFAGIKSAEYNMQLNYFFLK